MFSSLNNGDYRLKILRNYFLGLNSLNKIFTLETLQLVIGCNDGTLIIFDDYAEAAPHIIRDYRGNIAKITSFMLNQVRWLLVLYSVGVYTIPPGRTKWRFFKYVNRHYLEHLNGIFFEIFSR